MEGAEGVRRDRGGPCRMRGFILLLDIVVASKE